MYRTLGVLGGGQLGLMMLRPCIDLGVEVSFLDPNPECSVARFTSKLTVGDFKDYDTVLAFGRTVDVITVEIEHVNVEALEQLESEGKAVHPSPKLLRAIQDKGLQKQFYLDAGIVSPAFTLIENKEELLEFVQGNPSVSASATASPFEKERPIGLPIVQKARTGGYDGQGVQILRSETDLNKAFTTPSVLEDLVDLQTEIGVMVARNEHGEVRVFPPVSMDFDPDLNLVKYVVCPAEINESLNKKCVQLAKSVAQKFELVGIMAVELFVTKSGEVLVNECAPRVHNSGHLTLEGTSISQFEMHVRAVLGLPLPRVIVTHPSVMVNLVGEPGYTGKPQLTNTDEVLNQPGVFLHWYGKTETRPGRKMGHATVVRPTVEEAKAVADEVLEKLKVVA